MQLKAQIAIHHYEKAVKLEAELATLIQTGKCGSDNSTCCRGL